MEIWVPITESKNCMVSNYGRVKRLSYQIVTNNGRGNVVHATTIPEKILGGTKVSTKGYPRINLGYRTQFIHRLVAKYFISNPDSKPQINHKDGNKLNNHIDNLEWVTNQENRTHAVGQGLHGWVKSKFEPIHVQQIILLYKLGGTQKQIAEMYGTSQQRISKILAKA